MNTLVDPVDPSHEDDNKTVHHLHVNPAIKIIRENERRPSMLI